MTHVKDILGGLAVLIVALAVLFGVFGGGYLTAEHNRQKVERMIQLCVAKGYSGWEDSGRYATARCVK
jgi:hypothetical protein